MSAAPEASNPNIFDLQEAATASAKGPQFTGWHNNLFFVGGVCSQRRCRQASCSRAVVIGLAVVIGGRHEST